MTFTKILCPTDFSPGSQQAARVASRIARASGAALVFVHAGYIPPAAFALEVPLSPDLVQRILDDSQRVLDAEVADASKAGVDRVSGKLLSGVPWTRIVAELEGDPYDLCVIGTHGRTGLPRVLLGSVAEQVVRHAPCSVLTVRPESSPEPFLHALAPTDFSASAACAVELAPKLVEPGGSLTLLHVVEVPVIYSDEMTLADYARDLDEHAASVLDREADRIERLTGLAVSARSRIGVPGAQILAELDGDRTIDLVVMGSHGRTGIKRVLLGSVAEKVVRHARCPVLVARERVN